MDDEVDDIKDEAYDRIKSAIKESQNRVGTLINLLLISRHQHCRGSDLPH
jgi:phosphate transport system protein